MRKYPIVALAAAVVLVSACATRPNNIEAADVSTDQFASLDCGGLVSTANETITELAVFSKAQNAKADADAVTSIVAVVPASQLTGDHEERIATLKGEVIAIDSLLAQKQCDQSGVVREPDISGLKTSDYASEE